MSIIQKLQSINPSNYQILGTVDISTDQEIEDKVKLAKNAQKKWADLGVANRVSLLRKAFADLKKQEQVDII